MSEIEIEVGKRHIREINQDIKKRAKAVKKSGLVTLSRGTTLVGLPDGADITFEGSVGYYWRTQYRVARKDWAQLRMGRWRRHGQRTYYWRLCGHVLRRGNDWRHDPCKG